MVITKVGQNYGKATFFPSSSLHPSPSALLAESDANPSSGAGKNHPGKDHAPCPLRFPPSPCHCSTPAMVGLRREDPFLFTYCEEEVIRHCERELWQRLLGAAHPPAETMTLCRVVCDGDCSAPRSAPLGMVVTALL